MGIDMKTELPTIEECHAAGMTLKEAAAAMVCSYSAAQRRAWRRGLKMRPDYAGHAARGAEIMRRLNACPEFSARRNQNLANNRDAFLADPARNPLARLAPEQREEYDAFTAAGFTRAEAFKAIGVEL